METHILAIQAHCLRWVGLLWLSIGLYLGYDPFFVAWRAALAALISMIICGALLRYLARIIADQVSDELSEDELNENEQGKNTQGAATS